MKHCVAFGITDMEKIQMMIMGKKSLELMEFLLGKKVEDLWRGNRELRHPVRKPRFLKFFDFFLKREFLNFFLTFFIRQFFDFKRKQQCFFVLEKQFLFEVGVEINCFIHEEEEKAEFFFFKFWKGGGEGRI